MILQALKEYYDRKAAEPDSAIAKPGFEWKEIPYVIVLKPNGEPVNIASTFEGEGKAKRAKAFLLPQAVKKTSGISANLFWDNPEYALGFTKIEENSDSELGDTTKADEKLLKKKERVEKQFIAFRQRIDDLGDISDEGHKALHLFFEQYNKLEYLNSLNAWGELCDSGANLTFRLAGDTQLICQRPSVLKAIENQLSSDKSDINSICLMTGETEPIERLHTAIKGVWGAQTTGANIVSFNHSAFESFGKKQGMNAAVGKSAAFAYTTALNHLLQKDSSQRMQVGDASTVFWAQKPTELETGIMDIFGEPPKDDPDRATKAVKSLFKSMESGICPQEELDSQFYVLGLSPNAARISVRFWIVGTVAEISQRILQHFQDIRITHGPEHADAISIFRLLLSIAAQRKSENIPPNLAGDTMRAILEGLPYPHTLLQAAVRRNRAEQDVPYERAAIIKASINRRVRFNNPNIEEELKVSLDKTNENIGYRLGRLFATLERIQSYPNREINATIRSRYYGAASSTPVTVFSTLMRLLNHHLDKIGKRGARIFYEKLIAEIMEAVTDIPTHLSLADQGRFSIGYYHQMQDLYQKKETEDANSINEDEGDENNE